jgi:uncharacterized membrane protein
MGMATTASDVRQQRPARRPLDPTLYERILAVLAIVLLIMVVAALLRGSAEWHNIPAVIWLHLATIGVALVLTPTMLLRRRGDRLHRRLGWVWAAAMASTAFLSFFVRVINPGSFSLIHILSAWTLIQVPLIVWHARAHRQAAHRRAVVWMVTGALIIAGFFTFPYGRLLGHWLFG